MENTTKFPYEDTMVTRKSGWVNVAYAVFAVLLSLVVLHFLLVVDVSDTIHSGGDFTIRVNTFRRLDLLEKFLSHYTTCSCVSFLLLRLCSKFAILAY